MNAGVGARGTAAGVVAAVAAGAGSDGSVDAAELIAETGTGVAAMAGKGSLRWLEQALLRENGDSKLSFVPLLVAAALPQHAHRLLWLELEKHTW